MHIIRPPLSVLLIRGHRLLIGLLRVVIIMPLNRSRLLPVLLLLLLLLLLLVVVGDLQIRRQLGDEVLGTHQLGDRLLGHCQLGGWLLGPRQFRGRVLGSRSPVFHRHGNGAPLGGGHFGHGRVVPAVMALGLGPEPLALADGQREEEDQQHEQEDGVEEGLDDGDEGVVDNLVGEVGVNGDGHDNGEADEVENGCGEK